MVGPICVRFIGDKVARRMKHVNATVVSKTRRAISTFSEARELPLRLSGDATIYSLHNPRSTLFPLKVTLIIQLSQVELSKLLNISRKHLVSKTLSFCSHLQCSYMFFSFVFVVVLLSFSNIRPLDFFFFCLWNKRFYICLWDQRN